MIQRGVARLVTKFPGLGFERCLDWLRKHQHEDGSWGGEIFHVHDRIISTLSAIVALQKIGDPLDTERIRAGQAFIWHNFGRFKQDADDTIGFPVLVPTLINEALECGLDIPRTLSIDPEVVEKKLKLLATNPDSWRYTSLAYSLEAALPYLPAVGQYDFTEVNNLVGSSLSATAATLLNSQTYNEKALKKLGELIDNQPDSGAAAVNPIDVFEIAWSLNNLRLAGLISRTDSKVRDLLDFLYSVWSPVNGVNYSSCFRVSDLDDAAVTFGMLRWGGYKVSADVFSDYESETHFLCFPHEANPSLSANVRTLTALQWDRQHPKYRDWSGKIIKLLRTHDTTGYFWFDKWHVSPYYFTANTIWSLFDIIPDLMQKRIQWISNTQNADGGWGYHGASTLEETAYCLRALIYWSECVEDVMSAAIHKAAAFLQEHINDDLEALWIGKGLYIPYNVARSAIIMALSDYNRYNYLGNI